MYAPFPLLFTIRVTLHAPDAWQMKKNFSHRSRASFDAFLPAHQYNVTTGSSKSPTDTNTSAIIIFDTLAARRARLVRRHAWSRGHAWCGAAPGTAKTPTRENASTGRVPDIAAVTAQWRDCVHDSRVHDAAGGARAR